jgi:hypothetical protein
MLRFIVLLLVLVNGLYFAWAHEYLRGYGFGPAPTGEPQRLDRQIRPESIRILSAQDAQEAVTLAQTPAKPAECLQAGLFDERQAEAVQQALRDVVPQEAWSLSPLTEPARWIVLMGPYSSAEVLAKKRKELAILKINPEPVGNPKLEPGLSLGGYDSKAAAEAGLTSFSQRGVHTARVVQERAEATGALLKLHAVDEALRARLKNLIPVPISKPLQGCT